MTRSALFVRWVLGLSAAVFVALGLAFTFAPSMMIAAVDLHAEPGKALADVRAVYGGLDLAVGILLAVCFFRKLWANGLAISVLVCTCLLFGRLVGILADPARDILTFGLFASEVIGAVLSAVAWFLSRQAPGDTAAPPVAQAAPSTSGVPEA